jgi:DNA ligase D-like protein (predicted 3'-phosphoesterase)
MGQARSSPDAGHAVRASVRGDLREAGLREAIVGCAHELGVLGWVRSTGPGEILVHAEGAPGDVEALVGFLRVDSADSRVEEVGVEVVKPEGHEQFAIRGISAGRFELVEREGGGRGRFELRLEVDDAIRAWVLPRGPSLDPGVKRMAFESEPTAGDGPGAGSVWDEGTYEQGGRVPWPEAIDRGHAVFVLHGAKLNGGFALQRVRAGARPGWLLIKRRDEHARRGSDVIAGG